MSHAKKWSRVWSSGATGGEIPELLEAAFKYQALVFF